MERRSDSHKGENGTVAVIGGSSTIHGAPLLSALAAEASGVDLVYVCLPRCHADVAKATSLNFQVYPFRGDALTQKDQTALLELMQSVDTAVLGPGVTEGTTHLEALMANAPCAIVADAGALQAATLTQLKGKAAVVTPHGGELDRMGIEAANIAATAKDSGVTIFLKGERDLIAHGSDQPREITGGNAGLTVGGTGDVLAGLIGGLIAQGLDHDQACFTAGTVIKRAGAQLYHEKGYAYSAMDVIELIPHLLHTS